MQGNPTQKLNPKLLQDNIEQTIPTRFPLWRWSWWLLEKKISLSWRLAPTFTDSTRTSVFQERIPGAARGDGNYRAEYGLVGFRHGGSRKKCHSLSLLAMFSRPKLGNRLERLFAGQQSEMSKSPALIPACRSVPTGATHQAIERYGYYSGSFPIWWSSLLVIQ